MADDVEPTVVFATDRRFLLMSNDSTRWILTSSGSDRRMAFDPVRREILQFDYHCDETGETDGLELGCSGTLNSVSLSGQASSAQMGPEMGSLAGNVSQMRCRTVIEPSPQ